MNNFELINYIGWLAWVLFVNFICVMIIVNYFFNFKIGLFTACVLGFFVGAFAVITAPYWITCFGITFSMILTEYCLSY